MSDGLSHWPDVRDKPGFLHRLMSELAGDARISLEGDLSRCVFPDDLVVTRGETPVLKRATLAPRQGFVILRLTPDTVAPIFQQISVAGLTRAIIHVQIERNRVMELGAYDNFGTGCVVTGPGVNATLLEELKSKSVLRDFEAAPPDGT